MENLSLADLYEQDTSTPSGPQPFTPSLADLYELSEAGSQQPPVVDGSGASSPTQPAVSPPTDLIIDPALSGTLQSDADREAQRAALDPIQSPISGGLEAAQLMREQELARIQAEQRANRPLDPAGYPIDLDRPLVVVGEGDNRNIATEMTTTVPGTALGMPSQGIFYNIPTIINGVPMSPEAAAQLTGRLLASGEISLDDIPRFNSQEEAVAAANARSQAIGEMRKDDIDAEIERINDQDLRNRITETFAQPGPTQAKDDLLRILNPSVTPVTRLDDGRYVYNGPGGQTDIRIISAEEAAYHIQKANDYQMENTWYNRGYGRLLEGMSVLGNQLGITDNTAFIRRMAELDRIIPEAPKEIQDGLREISEAEGFIDSLQAIARNPIATLTVVGESAVVSIPSLATFIGGSLVSSPVGGAAAAGSVTFGTTFASIIADEIKSSGVDMQDEAAVMALIQDPAFFERARTRATGYAIPIAVFDALSMGLAGKLVGAGVQAGKGGLNITGRAVAETGIQMGLGAAGEAGGQAVEKALGFRDTFSPGEITLEAVAEGPLGVLEIAAGTPGQVRQSNQNAFNNALAEAEAQANTEAANQTAIDLLNPQSPAYGFVDPNSIVSQGMLDELIGPQEQATATPVQADVPDEAGGETTLTQTSPPDLPQPVISEPPTAAQPPVAEQPVEQPTAETPVEPPAQPPVVEQPPAAPVQPPAQETPPPVAEQPAETAEVSPQQVETPVGRPINEQQPTVKRVQTPDSQANYEVETVVVELADLKQAQGILQPRDRSLAESQVEATRRAGPDQFNPERLLDSPTTGDGAPIIARDGTIMSGNGRVLTLQEVYANQPQSRAAYSQALRTAGVNLEGFNQPVLVRRLTDTNMTMQDLKTFADLANTDAQARMSTTEAAQRDAQRMPPQVVNLYTGGDLTSLENKAFVDAFVSQVLSPTEQGQFSRDGKLTKDAVQRMQAAILATAYEDTDALAIMLDSTDDNIKAISNAMMSTAPRVSQLKADIASGNVRPEFDISPQIAEAAKLISSLRQRNIKPRDYFAQQDAFSDTDPIVEALIRSFYNDELTRAKSQKFMQDVLNFYVEESGNRKTEQLFDDPVTPTEVVTSARGRAERKADGTEEGQGSLLPQDSPGDRLETSREQAPGQRRQRGSQDIGTRQFESRQQPQEGVADDTRLESSLEASVQEDAELRGSEVTFDPAEVELREDTDRSTRGAKSGRVLTQEKETLRQSVYNQAFTDAGFDPNLARNFPPARQFKILSDLVMDKFGFKYIARPETNSYDANQALLDAYRNLQWMTHSLGLPYSAIGLDNSLGLALPGRQWGGYLAAFINSKGGPAAQTLSDVGRVPAPVIIMPKRSNSFAHEWGHALDYHIVEKYGADDGRGITGRIKTNLKADERVWLDNAPQNVQEAMGDLMNAMFFENAEVSYKLMELEQQLAKTRSYEAKTGKTTKKAAQIEEQIRRLREGSTKQRIRQSIYRKEAEEFAVAAQSDPDYWTRPTEMFARAFEAYVAQQVTMNGGNTEFITMSDEAYQMTRDQVEGADIRLALTYPNETDRNNIFLAMHRLIGELQAEMWKGVAKADAPGNYDMIDARVEFAAQIKEGVNKSVIGEMIAEERAGWKARSIQNENAKNRPVRFPEKSAFNRRFIGIEDSVISRVMYSKRGILFSIASRYDNGKKLKKVQEQLNKLDRNDPKRNALQQKAQQLRGQQRVRTIVDDLISRVATDPGGRRQTFEGGTFEEATTLNSRRFANTYKAIIDKHGLSELTTEELAQLRLILTADPDAQAAAAQGASPNLVQAAGEIRTKLLNPMYDYMRSNGLEITYLQDGSYMPRMLDSQKVDAEEAQFLYGPTGKPDPNAKRGAYAMYHNVIYENEFGPFEEGNTDQVNALVALGRKLPLEEEVAENVAELRRIQNRINKLNGELENAAPGADTDGIEAEIAQLSEEMNDLHGQVYEELRDPFAQTASQDWYTRISVQAGADPEAHAAQGRFTQKRKLPPEADSYMVDYYLDPVESLNVYIPSVARKVETEKRFGKSLVPKGQKRGILGRGPHETIDFLEYQIQQAQLAGMDNADAQQVRIVINKILGRDATTKDMWGKKALDYVHTYGTMALLPRAVLSSIAEPLTAGIQTGSVKKGAETFFKVFDEALGMVNTSARERTLFYRQMANVLGVVDDPSVGQMVANRLGGTLAEDPKLNARLSRFFVRTKLQGLTNAQRRSTMRTMLQYLAEISAEYQDGQTTPQGKKRIENVMQDLGIYGDNLDQFTKWMSESKEGQFKSPALEDIIGRGGELTDMGNLLAIAVGRAVDQTIQDPKSVDRPMYAEHPLGRMVFGIQSFMRAYTRNVLLASAKKVNREYQDNGMASAATMTALQMIPNFALLYGGHLMVSTLREAIFNGDRLEREREDDNLVPYLMELGFMRAGFYGAFDPWVNMYKSLRYEADSKTILVGASLSFYSRALDRMLGVTNRFRNSPNTVAAEYQAAVGFWDTFVTTGVSTVASMPGPGPLVGTALGLGASVVTSPTVKHTIIREFIDALYGEEYYPGTRSSGRAEQSKSLGTSR